MLIFILTLTLFSFAHFNDNFWTLFNIYRSVVSFLIHQLTEDDEDYTDELLNLNVTWNLLLPPRGVVRGKKCNIVIVPISDQFGQSRIQFTKPGGGNHWSILLWGVMVHQQQQQQQHHDDENGSHHYKNMVDVRYYHFDSCQGTNCKAAETVAHKLHKVCYVVQRKIMLNIYWK
jgi:hypothetical protein